MTSLSADHKPLQTILVVDDETHVRKYISLLLSKVCPQVTQHQASNSAQALESIQQFGPQVVLLDINMPGTDGLKTLEKIKDLGADCKVIMLTSVNIRRSVQTAIELGAAGYILKDCSYHQVEASMRSLLERFFPAPAVEKGQQA
jgi:DNA-binding NarL/FixJ family response regulator